MLGNTGGLAFQGILVCLGLGSLLAKSDAVFTTLKLIGAAYLIILGIRTIRDRGHLAGALSGLDDRAAQRRARILREGFVVGATNPKGLLIFTAVLPQFIEPARGHATLQLPRWRRSAAWWRCCRTAPGRWRQGPPVTGWAARRAACAR